jgi:hypothetical protein
METANYWNLSKSKGHNSVKNGSIVPKTELDLDILKINLCIKYHFNMCNQCEENERKLQGPQLCHKWLDCQKWLDHAKNISWSRYSYDKSVYQMSFQYVQPVRRKWTRTANYWNFLSLGAITVKNGSIVPKTELDLDILNINMFTKYHFNMCSQSKENERKLGGPTDRPTDCIKAICTPFS